MATGHVLRTLNCRLLLQRKSKFHEQFQFTVRNQTTNTERSKSQRIDPGEYFLEKTKKYQMEAAKFAKKKEKNARYWGLGLLSFVVGVYLFTISKVKQEKFLDETFDTNELAQSLEAKAEN